MKQATKKHSKPAARKPAVERTLTPGDLEEIERRVRQALAVALYMSESGAEEHANYAASAISESLHEARCIFEGRKGEAS